MPSAASKSLIGYQKKHRIAIKIFGGTEMANEELRNKIRIANVRHWQIAHELGISEETLCRHLRFELPQAERERLLAALDQLTQ